MLNHYHVSFNCVSRKRDTSTLSALRTWFYLQESVVSIPSRSTRILYHPADWNPPYISLCILSGAQLYTNRYKSTQIVRWCTLYNLTITTFDTPRSTTKTLGFYCQRRDKPAAPWASPFPASQVASRPSCWHRNCCPKATTDDISFIKAGEKLRMRLQRVFGGRWSFGTWHTLW